MGRRLGAELLRRGHRVRALVRPGSESRAASGAEVVAADPLDTASYRDRVAGCDTFVDLVGVAHPSPAKAAQFRSIDLVSAKAAISAATSAGIRHFVYVSVAHPAPVMRAYIAARVEGEDAIRESGLPATILRPWYVLGSGPPLADSWPDFPPGLPAPQPRHGRADGRRARRSGRTSAGGRPNHRSSRDPRRNGTLIYVARARRLPLNITWPDSRLRRT